MLWGGFAGELEVRRSGGATRLRGSFPYNKTATLSDGGRRGRPRKEKFVPGAFNFRVQDPKKEIHLLVGHDYGAPLASKLTDTLDLKDTVQALTFEARIRPEIAETSYGRDVLAQIAAGLAFGVSVGFRLPPQRAVEKVEEIEEEPDDGSLDANGDPRRGALIRTVLAALLYEISIVTRPAYKESQIEARNWSPDSAITDPPEPMLRHALNRWRP